MLGSTQAQEQTRELSDFNSLSVSGGIKVNMHYGKPKAEIEVTKGDIEKLKTEVKGDHLKIYFDNKWSWTGGKSQQATIDLYFKTVDEISSSAGATIKCSEVITVSSFEADASSGSRIEAKVEAGSVDSDVSSGASIAISGAAKDLNVDVSSGASFRGDGLEAKAVDADVSSGGSIKVWATHSLTADASSGGSIKYKGNPEKTNIDSGKYSGGSVKKM